MGSNGTANGAGGCPSINLPSDFFHEEVDFSPNSCPGDQAPAPLGVLKHFQGEWAGTGFNTIFRPTNNGTNIKFANPVVPSPPKEPNLALLELNLTKEKLSFSEPLGSIPNRGMKTQDDIFLNGISYEQTVWDVTNTATGLPDGTPTGIHKETGFWMHVPATTNPESPATLVRMGSIPHGTTINAQGGPACPTPTEGPPPISLEEDHIMPIRIQTGGTDPKQNMVAKCSNTPRLPQDLGPFIATGTITQEILTKPRAVLTNINSQLNILDSVVFTVGTKSQPPEKGGGTANIAFLTGQNPSSPNADVVEMEATFWIETVQTEINIPASTPGEQNKPIQPALPPSNMPPPLPTFSVPPTKQILSARTITVTYKQIQYAQKVILSFNGVLWPHISVATLVPAEPIVLSASQLNSTC